tara:strand:- start:149 stop:292 length:144 start_codon:yes stop_codon:yes gene_type:complete
MVVTFLRVEAEPSSADSEIRAGNQYGWCLYEKNEPLSSAHGLLQNAR